MRAHVCVSLCVCLSVCLTDDHPDCESAPGTEVQHHHEVDVDEHAEDRQPGQQGDLERSHAKESVLLYHTLEGSWLPPSHWLAGEVGGYLKGQRLLALGLSPDDEDAEAAAQCQGNADRDHGRVRCDELGEVSGQHHAQ